MKLRVLQWNIWFKEPVQNIIAFLRETNADIICLQELTVNHELHGHADVPKLIAHALGYHYYFVPAHTFSTGYQIGNAIFTRFAHTNDAFYYVQHARAPYHTDEMRVYVQTDVLIDGKMLTVATTHLSYSTSKRVTVKRKYEVAQLLSQLMTKTERFIFAGDLNATPNSYTVKQISKHLRHCGPSLRKPTWSTKRFASGPAEYPGLHYRLDYVFATPDIVVLDAAIPLTGYSDHLPVVVDITI